MEYDYDDIFVCEFAYQRSTQAFIPSKEERWGAVQESYLFERFDAPLQSRRKFTVGANCFMKIRLTFACRPLCRRRCLTLRCQTRLVRGWSVVLGRE